MCSIFGIFGLQPGDDIPALRREALDRSQRQRHRGPDWSGVYLDAGAILVHERLAIVDFDRGAYLAWLNARPDTQAHRAAWASPQSRLQEER